MSTSLSDLLSTEYLELREKFVKLDTELKLLKSLLANVAYTNDQTESLMEAARRKVDKLREVDQDMYATEQMLEVLRLDETMESSSTVH